MAAYEEDMILLYIITRYHFMSVYLDKTVVYKIDNLKFSHATLSWVFGKLNNSAYSRYICLSMLKDSHD